MRLTSILSVCFLLIACNGGVRSDKKGDTQLEDTSADAPKPMWVDSPRSSMAINTLLSHKRSAFRCDSAVIVNYLGVFNGHVYMPVNDKGQWISSITKRKKLTVMQVKTINSIIGNPASYIAAQDMCCVKPNIGIVYFKDGRVVAQTAMSLECTRVRSTAQLGSNDYRHLFNKKTLKKLEKFYAGLKM